MQNKPAILKTKLRVPKIQGTIHREQLLPILSDIGGKKIAVVVAGAGYGKTTLVSQSSELSGLPTVWYSLDDTDIDISVFMTYLITGIRQHYENFGQQLLTRMGTLFSSDLNQKNFLISFLEEMENIISEDLVIVLDDYQHVQDSSPISDSLSFLLQRLPPSIHFIIISRTEPNIQLSRLRSKLDVIDINENNLMFNLTEVKTLFNQVLKFQLSNRQLKKLCEMTEGWVAGLILFYHSIKASKFEEIDPSLNRLEGVHNTLYSYFEENIFRKLSIEIQNFMLKTSILANLNIHICNAFLGIDTSASILAELEKTHLFTIRSPGEQSNYSYHHLLKEFLERKLRLQMDQKTLNLLHCSAGSLLRTEGFFEEALKHYLYGKEFEKARQLFLEINGDLLLAGRINLIQQFFQQMPEIKIQREPQLLLFKGRLLSLSGKPIEALKSLKIGLKTINQKKSPEIAARFRKELGMQYYYSGEIHKAISEFKNVLKTTKIDHDLAAETSGMLSFLYTVQGKIHEADKILNSTQHYIQQLEGNLKLIYTSWLNQFQSFRYYCTGDFIKSKLFARDGLRIIQRLNLEAFLPLAYLQLSYADTSIGNHKVAEQDAQKGIKAAIKMGFNESFLAWLYLIEGQSNIGLGCFDKSLHAIQKSFDLFQFMGNNWGMANCHNLFSRVYLLTERNPEVDHHLELGYSVIKGQQFPLIKGLLDIVKIIQLLKRNKLKIALENIERALSEARLSKHITFLLMMQKAGLNLKVNNITLAVESLLIGLQIAQDNNYSISNSYELQTVWPQLMKLKTVKEIKPIWGNVIDIKNPIPTCFSKTVSENPQISTDIPVLRIQCFGEFRVYKDEIEMPREDWKNSKSVQLFKYLVSKSAQGYTPRDILIEILWPNEAATKCHKRLNVALTKLRDYLEPDRKSGEKSSYVLRQKDAYRIDLGAGGTTDVLEFINTAQSGDDHIKQNPEDLRQSMEFYLKSISFRKRDFLENDLYWDWCNKERNRLNQIYLSILSKIIDFHESNTNYDEGLRYAQMFLNIDQYREDIYRKMMFFYSKTGNNPMIFKTYEKCKLNLKEGLNCPLTPETIHLFGRLTQTKK